MCKAINIHCLFYCQLVFYHFLKKSVDKSILTVYTVYITYKQLLHSRKEDI